MSKAKPVTDAWFLKLKENLQSGKKTVPVSYPNQHYNTKFNKVKIIVKDNHVEHWLNGTKILVYKYQSEAFKALVSKSKFRDMPFFAKANQGSIGLQGDHGEVWYKNIRIRKL